MKHEEYETIEAMNWGTLVHMATSPMACQFRMEKERRDTEAFALGRAIHCAVLEPERFDEEYAIKPDGMKLSTKEGKAWALGQGDKLIADITVVRCRDAIMAHPLAVKVLSECDRVEETILWTDEQTGIKCKGRLDMRNAVQFADIKSTKALVTYRKDFSSYRVHGQMAWYGDGAATAKVLPPNAPCYIIAVETAEPYDVWVAPLSQTTVEVGRRLWRRLLDLYAQCMETGIWPGMFPAAEPMELMPWADGMNEPMEDW